MRPLVDMVSLAWTPREVSFPANESRPVTSAQAPRALRPVRHAYGAWQGAPPSAALSGEQLLALLAGGPPPRHHLFPGFLLNQPVSWDALWLLELRLVKTWADGDRAEARSHSEQTRPPHTAPRPNSLSPTAQSQRFSGPCGECDFSRTL